MDRKRILLLVLTVTLIGSTGCMSPCRRPLFSRLGWRFRSREACCPEPCCPEQVATGFVDPGSVPMVSGDGYEGPILTGRGEIAPLCCEPCTSGHPAPTMVIPSGTVPPIPSEGIDPRLIPQPDPTNPGIPPQAIPKPYQPMKKEK